MTTDTFNDSSACSASNVNIGDYDTFVKQYNAVNENDISIDDNILDNNPFYSFFLSQEESAEKRVFKFDNFVQIDNVRDLIPHFEKNKYTLCRIDTEYDGNAYCFEFVVENTGDHYCGRIYRLKFLPSESPANESLYSGDSDDSVESASGSVSGSGHEDSGESGTLVSYGFYKVNLLKSFRRALHGLGEGITYIFCDDDIIPDEIYNTRVYVYQAPK